MCSKEEGHLPYNVCTVYFYKGFEKLWGQIVQEGWHFAVSARNIIRVSAISRACSSCDRLSCGQILSCRSKCGLMESLQELPTGSFWKFSSQGPISGFCFFFSTHNSTTVVPVSKAVEGGTEYLKKIVTLHLERQMRMPCSGTGLLRVNCTFAALLCFVNLFQKKVVASFRPTSC